jgi:glutamate carboxypeptidase
MDRRTAAVLRAWLTEREHEMTALLEELVLAESPSLEPAALSGPHSILTRELEALGHLARPVAGGAYGQHLYARPRHRYRRAGYQVLIGHLDTVWPLGSLADMPVHNREGELYGPGTYDMKAGLVEIVFALRALTANGLVPAATPVVFVNADEEVGSLDSGRHIVRLARGAARALVLEGAAGREGRLKTSRKGSGRFTLTVRGRAAHAGSSPEEGVSAILELAEQIKRLNALNDRDRGVTVNVGMVDGGLRPNVVAPIATAEIDVRVSTAADASRVESEIRALDASLPGATVDVTGGFRRPPMEPSPASLALFHRAQELGALLGLDVGDAGVVGGSSDANLTSPYTPTLDGLGPIGDGAHAADERVLASSLAERAALLALLVLEPASRDPDVRPRRRRRGSRTLLLGSPGNETNRRLLVAWRRLGVDVELVPPSSARHLRRADVAIGRLDVLPTLDGVEPGLLELLLLERSGAVVLNGARALLQCHDKWRTAQVLERADLPHPWTTMLLPGARAAVEPPVVVKPRFGSWGIDVERCRTTTELELALVRAARKPWFRRHGALLQELIPSSGTDLRVVVGRGEVVGAIERVAQEDEWRTNTSLGAVRRPIEPPREACALAVAAARAVGADLVGVDLLPLSGGGFSVIELNGAVDFAEEYGLGGHDAYEDAALALGLLESRASGPRRGPTGRSVGAVR